MQLEIFNKESNVLKYIKTFLDDNKISYSKIAPSLYTKCGVPDIQGTFENGKIFRIELKRFVKSNTTLLQKYKILNYAKNNEIVFYINNYKKLKEFEDFIINKKYL